MHDMIFWGVLVSLVFAELSGISPGGVIVPTYFVLYLYDPWRVALTLGLALVCVGLVRLLSRFMILYGRRRLAMYLLIGIVLKFLLGEVYASGPLSLPNLSLSIGYVIPGLLGRDVERQGIVPTFAALGVVCCLLLLLRAVLTGGAM